MSAMSELYAEICLNYSRACQVAAKYGMAESDVVAAFDRANGEPAPETLVEGFDVMMSACRDGIRMSAPMGEDATVDLFDEYMREQGCCWFDGTMR